MSNRPIIEVLPSQAAVCNAAATAIAGAIARAIDERGVAHWATTGGSVAPGIYAALRVPPLRDAVDWSRLHVWWGDDRFVPLADALCNVQPFEALVSGRDGVSIPATQVHRIPSEDAIVGGHGPDWAAAQYAASLRSVGPALNADGVPVLDVIVLGMGSDGHIMSVFPGSAVFDADTLVAGVPAPTHIEPQVPRVTMHPRMVTAARLAILATAGAQKAPILARALAGGDPRELPVRVAAGPNATWLLDVAAAADLR